MDNFIDEFYENRICQMTPLELQEVKSSVEFGESKSKQYFQEIVKEEFLFHRVQVQVFLHLFTTKL